MTVQKQEKLRELWSTDWFKETSKRSPDIVRAAVSHLINTVYYIADIEESRYTRGTFADFLAWFYQQKSYQLDIETNVFKWWTDAKLISLQFGSCTEDRVQWFLQWSTLSELEQMQLAQCLEDRSKLKLIHKASFEYIVLRFHDIIIENMYDTLVGEKVLQGGMENLDYALADISFKYVRVRLDKTLQISFGDNVITDAKILYGTTDVMYLDIIRQMQLEDAKNKELINVLGLEMDAIPALGDITYHGMKLSREKWEENIRLAEPVVQAATDKLNSWLFKEPLHKAALDMKYLSEVDRVVIKWDSHQQKAMLLERLFPGIPGGTLTIIRAYLRDHGRDLSADQMNVLTALLEKNTEPMQEMLVTYHRDYLIEKGLLQPANMPTINWRSVTDQVLPLFKVAIPKLKKLNEEERAKYPHPLLKDFEWYGNATKLLSTYGTKFLHDHVDPNDGMVRTNINSVVSTGRISSADPNMQNIPVDEEKLSIPEDPKGTRYRNAFTYLPGWIFVDSDYTSQELVILAYMSKDPVWLGVLTKEQDLHSVCAELVYKDKWKDAADSDCAYYKRVVNQDGVLEYAHKKCSCKKHKPLRYNIKTVNFMIIYGAGEFKLAAELDITVKESKYILDIYFQKLPAVVSLLKYLGEFGLKRGFIQTLYPFFRKRWFPGWVENRQFVSAHIAQIRFNKALGNIERQSKNHPIQGSSADIVKLALVTNREWIRDNGYIQDIRIVAQVHDQITTVCRTQQIAEMWRSIMDTLMLEAALVVIPSGILKADTQITEDVWTK